MNKSLIVGLVAALAGCILVVDERGETDSHWASSYDDHSDERLEADRRLANRVKDELEFDELLRHEDIEVRAHGDTISLHGRLSDVALLGRAMELAASTQGVRKVRSRLTVVYEN